MREIPTRTCPFCSWSGPLTKLGHHVTTECPRRHEGRLTPPASAVESDAQWFEQHPNSWRLRRRVTADEATAYREQQGLAADATVAGYVTVHAPYSWREQQARYDYDFRVVGEEVSGA